MKKTILFLSAIFWILTSFAQQRLAVFMEGAVDGFAPSVCLDFFRDAPDPGDNSYIHHSGEVPDGFTIAPESFSRVGVPTGNNSGLPNKADPLYFSPKEDLGDISTQKKDFVRQQYDILKTTHHFDAVSLDQAQKKIWSFDIMEKLGYVDKTLPPGRAYKTAMDKLSADFSAPGNPLTEDDVIDLGSGFKTIFESGEDIHKSLLLVKSRATKELIAFNNIAPPIARGSSGDVAASLNDILAEDDIVQVDLYGFETAARENAAFENLKTKLLVSYDKDVILSRDLHGDSWVEHSYSFTRTYNESTVESVTAHGQAAVGSIIRLKDDWGDNVTVSARANNRNLLSSFFGRLTRKITELRDQVILGRAVRSIRKQVLSEAGSTSRYFLDCTIAEEGKLKDILRIDRKKTEVALNHVRH